MPKWKGNWEFRNVMRTEHGTTGKDTVDAEDEPSAREKIQLKASQALFGTTMMHTYVHVSGLTKLNDRW